MALKIWLPMNDGTLKNQGLLELPLLSTNGFASDADGKLGSCCTGYGIYHFDEDFLNNSWTIALWVKTTKWGVNNDILLCKNADVSTSSQFYFSVINGNAFNLGINGNSSATQYSYTFNTDQWYHLAATYDGQRYALYINGDKVKTGERTASKIEGHLNLGISCRSNNVSGTSMVGYTAKKNYNDIRIYDNALSELEVKHLSQALVLHYSLSGNNGTLANENLLPETSSEEKTYTYPTSSYKDWYQKASLVPLTKSEYILSFYAKSTVSGDKIHTYFYSPNTTTKVETSAGVNNAPADGHAVFELTTEWQKFWVKYTQSETTTIKRIICPRLINGDGTGTVSVKCVKLEEGHTPTPWCPNPSDALYTALGYDDGIEYDTSGYGNNGTIVGTLNYSTDSPRYLASTVFDGTQAIRLGRRLYDSASQLTVTEWFKTNTRNSTSPNLFSLGENSFLRVRLNTNNTLWWYIKGQNDTYTAPSSLIDNKWHFFAITFNSGIVKMYLDGVLVETKDISSAMSEIVFAGSDATFWGLGGYSASAEKYVGHLSDFRVYSSCLSDTDIQKLYTVSASIDSNGNAYSAAYVEG